MNKQQLVMQLENIRGLIQSAIEYIKDEDDYVRADRVLTDYVLPGVKDAANVAFSFGRMSGVGK